MAKRKKIGLALGSGGSRGFAHIGVIKVLVDNNIPIDFISGTSAGSIVGGMYSLTKDIDEVLSFCTSMDYFDFLKIFADPVMQSGVIRGNRIEEFVELFTKGAKIQDTKIPFRAVTTDVNTGDRYIFKKGQLAKALRASSSIPVFMKPLKYGKRLLIDGGASEPVPVKTTREMGADVVIAINLDSVFFPDIETTEEIKMNLNMAQIAKESFYLLRYNLAKSTAESADHIIEPHVKYTFFRGFTKVNEIIKIGEKAAIKALPEIMKLIS